MKSHFFAKVPSDPWNPQNASWGKEPISIGCLSSLAVLSSHNDSCGSRPPTGLCGKGHLATLALVPEGLRRQVPSPLGHKGPLALLAA